MYTKKNILHISLDFNYSCGVSRYVCYLLDYFSKNPGYNMFFLTNGGDSLERISNTNLKVKVSNLHTGWRNIIYFVK